MLFLNFKIEVLSKNITKKHNKQKQTTAMNQNQNLFSFIKMFYFLISKLKYCQLLISFNKTKKNKKQKNNNKQHIFIYFSLP